MKRPRAAPDAASLTMNDGDDVSSFSSASTYCCPGRRRKYQRTMEDAFRSFSIGKEKQQVLPTQNDTSTFTSGDDPMKDTVREEEEEDEQSSCSSLEDELLLTDQERAERKVMFELVFGKSHESVVEAKLQEWILRTAREATSSTNRQPGICQDDMHLPSTSGLNETKSCDMFARSDNMLPRQRSNSLPTDLSVVGATDEMAVEDIADPDGMEMSL